VEIAHLKKRCPILSTRPRLNEIQIVSWESGLSGINCASYGEAPLVSFGGVGRNYYQFICMLQGTARKSETLDNSTYLDKLNGLEIMNSKSERKLPNSHRMYKLSVTSLALHASLL